MGLFRRTNDRQADTITNDADAAPVDYSGSLAAKDAELQEMRETIMEMHRVIHEVADRGSAQEKVFDVLHNELQEYKNDFIYEHLKPVLWPLLFLFDSLEQYAREIVQRVSTTNAPELEAKEVLDHLKFFRGQLVEALRICEVTPMKQPSGLIDPKHHKGIGVEKVDDPADENSIRRVVRTGWYLNGKVLRHAEVIIGKTEQGMRDQQMAAQQAAQASAAEATSQKSGAGKAGKDGEEKGSLLRAAGTLLSSSDASASGGGRGV